MAGSPWVTAARHTRCGPRRRSHPRSADAGASHVARPWDPPAPAAATPPPKPTNHPSNPTDTRPRNHSRRAQRPRQSRDTADLKHGLRPLTKRSGGSVAAAPARRSAPHVNAVRHTRHRTDPARRERMNGSFPPHGTRTTQERDATSTSALNTLGSRGELVVVPPPGHRPGPQLIGHVRREEQVAKHARHRSLYTNKEESKQQAQERREGLSSRGSRGRSSPMTRPSRRGESTWRSMIMECRQVIRVKLGRRNYVTLLTDGHLRFAPAFPHEGGQLPRPTWADV